MPTARWRQLADDLLQKIEEGEYGVGSRLPTSSQLAAQSGVSLVTAHKALEELKRAGYVARSGRRGTTVVPRPSKSKGRIALIFDQIDFAYSFPRPELLAAIHAGVGAQYDLLICDSKASVEREQELLNRMAEECDGIICWPTGGDSSAETIEKFVKAGTPLVLLDRVPAGIEVDAVLTDSVSATRQASEFLIERGHKRVGLLTFDNPQISTVQERSGTFEAVMSQHEIASPELVRRFPASLEVQDRAHFPQVFNDALFTLLNGPSPATAVLCVQDLLGLAVLKYAEEAGLNIPDDLEIVTFNDWPAHWLGRPWQVHRIAVRPGDMGAVAISRLLAQIDGQAGEPALHRIPTVFLPADSLIDSALYPRLERPLEVS